MKDEYPCLKSFKYIKNQIRIFEKTLEENSVLIKKEPDATDPKQPLKKMSFSTVGKLSKKNNEIKLLIEKLGGKIVTTLDDSTVALITNAEQIEKMSTKVTQAQTLNVHAIDEAFLHELSNQPAEKITSIEQLILKHDIGKWGSDLKTRIKTCVGINELHEKLKKNANETKYASKSTGTIKLKIKGGAAVDPDSGLEDDAHILSEPKTSDPYSCVLGYVDIARGSNSYYKLQLIEHDKKAKFYVFRSWGRVGTSIGGNKLTDYTKKEQALEEFYEVYLKQTGNNWKDRKIEGKKPNKFYPLEMDYGENEVIFKKKLKPNNTITK